MSPFDTRPTSFNLDQPDLHDGYQTLRADHGMVSPTGVKGLGVIAVLLVTVLGIGMVAQSQWGAPESETSETTQQLEAQGPHTPAEGTPDLPAPDATGVILTFDGITINREAASVQSLSLPPGTYVKAGELWGRANGEGVVLLPADTKVEELAYFDAADQQQPLTDVNPTVTTVEVTAITFAGDLIGGFTSDEHTSIWYPQADFQADPSVILIPRGRTSETGVFVGDTFYTLALPDPTS